MNYVDFRKKVVTDSAFASKFKDCKDPASLIAAAAKEGYNFTEDDIKNNTDLLPEELELAAGGKTIAHSNWFVTDKVIVNP
ncbi:MAG: Nif11-like leader peptide family natural product precursor [Lachnospiraceae bacterium]|nr:Nif11-like leader peptide family natural product precursor [Lachnospiraceae bacterium]